MAKKDRRKKAGHLDVASYRKQLEHEFKNDIVNRLIQNKIKLRLISEKDEASERERLLRIDRENLLDLLTLTIEKLAEKTFLAQKELYR